eukprot:TRINITY_DN571_c0_g1_i1.p1 TRINITY_DN571_c0_g1~~TRINITY_DN571_c0_g1_i1.p1  ORF type:complete len:512 (-),score=91.92 TRINITY_DN571_c0_g1_i1:67-1554(-)
MADDGNVDAQVESVTEAVEQTSISHAAPTSFPAQFTEGCPRCGKKVFFAEAKKGPATGMKDSVRDWHKNCYKCLACQKPVDSVTQAVENGEVFCKSCHAKHFGPKGFRGGGAAAVATNLDGQSTQAAPTSTIVEEWDASGKLFDTGCPRCGKTVYFAEAVKVGGAKEAPRDWHRHCYKCRVCRKALDSGTTQIHEGDVFCKTCFGKYHGPKGFRGGGAAAATALPTSLDMAEGASSASAPQDGVFSSNPLAPGGQELESGVYETGCPRCGKAVYFAELVKVSTGVSGNSRDWHKSCMKCKSCKVKLDSHSMSVHEQEVYCKGCYASRFGAKGFRGGVGQSAVGTDENPERGASAPLDATPWGEDAEGSGPFPEGCPRCGKTVYFAEAVKASGKEGATVREFHRHCFKCRSCKKALDSTTAASHDSEVYCKFCHAKNFGMKGYGFGGGAGTLSSDPGTGSPALTRSSLPAEEPVAEPDAAPAPAEAEPEPEPAAAE